MIGMDLSRALQSSRRREMSSEEIDETLRRILSGPLYSRRAAEARARERRRVPGFLRRWLIWQGLAR